MIATPKLSGDRLDQLQLQITEVKSLLAQAETRKVKNEFVAMGEKEIIDEVVNEELRL